MKVLKWGLIGCGDIARRRVAPALMNLKECSLQGISRANVNKLQEFAEAFNVKETFSNWQNLVQSPCVDAVYIATPVSLHKEMTVLAAESGKHVLCEKPMAMNAGECQKMIDACKANHVQLGIAYYRHFYPVIKAIKALIEKKEIGDVMMVQVNAFSNFDRQLGEDRAWLLDPALSGGGPMMDFGCHRIEVLMNLLGPVADVSAIVKNLRYQRQVEDTAIAHLFFESGTVASLTVTHAVAERKDTLEIFGTLGSLECPDLNRGDLYIKVRDKPILKKLPPHANLHQPLIDAFTDSVLKAREPAVNGQTGLKVNQILEKIYT